MIYRYVLDRLAGTDGLAKDRKVSQRTLMATEHENRVYGAEVARAGGDLDAVCQAAQGGRSCDVLHAWDGHSDIGSRGTQIFQEFWKRAQDVQGLWQVPFDAADPVNAPRDLNAANPLVVQAMKDALAYLTPSSSKRTRFRFSAKRCLRNGMISSPAMESYAYSDPPATASVSEMSARSSFSGARNTSVSTTQWTVPATP